MPVSAEVQIRRLTVPDQLGRKSLPDPVSMEKFWVWWRASVIPAMVGSVKRRIVVRAGLDRK
jgi:hypothetical protein